MFDLDNFICKRENEYSLNSLSDEEMQNINAIKSPGVRLYDIGNYHHIEADEELAQITMTPLDHLKKYNNWYFKNGEFVYFKKRTGLLQILNELLGEYLSEYMNLPTVKYKVVEHDGEIAGLVSPIFKNSSYNYFPAYSLNREKLKKIKRILKDPSFECDEETRKLLTAYIVRNYYASQKDRMVNVLYATSSKSDFIMAPLYDYEASFDDPEMMHIPDPMIEYNFNPESIAFLRQNNAYFEEYIELIKSFKIHVALKKIEMKKNIVIPSYAKEYYKDYDQKRKLYMKNIGF